MFTVEARADLTDSPIKLSEYLSIEWGWLEERLFCKVHIGGHPANPLLDFTIENFVNRPVLDVLSNALHRLLFSYGCQDYVLNDNRLIYCQLIKERLIQLGGAVDTPDITSRWSLPSPKTGQEIELEYTHKFNPETFTGSVWIELRVDGELYAQRHFYHKNEWAVYSLDSSLILFQVCGYSPENFIKQIDRVVTAVVSK